MGLHTAKSSGGAVKLQLVIAGALLIGGAALGWVLHKTACPVIAAVQNPQTAIWEGIVSDLSSRLRSKDAAIAAASNQLLAANKGYQDSLLAITRKEHDDSLQMAAAKTPRDSASSCSVVLLDCERRAGIAEARAASLQAQLGAQVKVGSRRCGLFAGAIPLRIDFPFKPHLEASVGIGLGCQVL